LSPGGVLLLFHLFFECIEPGYSTIIDSSTNQDTVSCIPKKA
jgi:hypothetical protein